VAYFFDHIRHTCRKSSFFGHLQMELLPSSAIFIGRTKIRNQNCDLWREESERECRNYFIQARYPDSLKKNRKRRSYKLFPPTIIHHELPQPQMIYLQITIHEAGECDNVRSPPLRKIDFYDYLPGVQDESHFVVPSHFVCKRMSLQKEEWKTTTLQLL